MYDAADGPLVITVGNNAQFQRLCNDVLERPDLAAGFIHVHPRLGQDHRPAGDTPGS